MRLILLPIALLACSGDSAPTAPATDPSPALGAPGPAPTAAESAPLPADAPQRIMARHILISYQGALGAKKELRRNPAEAKALAEQLRAQLEGGADFATLAIRSSDDPASNIRGGALGAFGRGEMDASFEGAAFRLPVNGLSPVVETPFGFHVIQRLELVEVRLGQVLVQWAGAQGSKATRSREEAKAQAEQALTRLKAGESLATVASQLSDGPTGPRGGDLGWFQKGQMVAVLDEAAFALQPGGVSGLIESPAGFHVLVRLAPPFTDSPGPSAPPGTPR